MVLRVPEEYRCTNVAKFYPYEEMFPAARGQPAADQRTDTEPEYVASTVSGVVDELL